MDRKLFTRKRISRKRSLNHRSVNTRERFCLRIRPMHESVVATVKRLENQCYPYPWPASLFRGAIRTRMNCWVIEADHEVIGFGIAHLKRHWLHLMNVCIAAKYRNRGLGKKLTAHLLSEARKQHAAYSWLEVRPDNHAAINLYKTLGFRCVTLRKKYYPSPRGRLPAIVMAKKLKRQSWSIKV